MDTMNLSIIISSIAGGAILGIKKTTSEFKKLAKAGGDVNEKIKIANETSINFFKKSALSAFRTGVAISAITKPAIEFESAMADVKKVVDFDTPKQFEEMQSDILKLTRSLPLASNELAQIATSGGQLGVARKDITSFTTTIAKMATAFDMSAGDSGDASFMLI